MDRNNSSLSSVLEANNNIKYINGAQRRFDSSNKDILQREVADIAALVQDTSDELAGITAQWQCMVDLLSARLIAWRASTCARLETLSQHVQDVEQQVNAFATDLDADASTLHAMHAALADERASFAAHMHAAKQEFEATRALATNLNTAATGRVKLNVGGWRYEVAMDTLCRSKGSFFARLLEGSFKLVRDEDGCVFLDRDGGCYVYIINWLRDGAKAVMPEDDAMMKRVAVEVHLFGWGGDGLVMNVYGVHKSQWSIPHPCRLITWVWMSSHCRC